MFTSHTTSPRPAILIALTLVVTTLFVVNGASRALAAESTLVPAPSMLPNGNRPPIEAPRPRAERAVPDVPSTAVVMDQSLKAGNTVRLSDVKQSVRPRQSKPHVQGDGNDGISSPPQQPPTSQPPTIDLSSTTTRAPGAVYQLFDGIDSNDTFNRPPDTHLAVGPQYAVEVANSGFTVFSKLGGTTRAYRTFENFLENQTPNLFDGDFFDPRIVYDPTYQKFVMLILGKDDDREISGYWIAVSEDSDPRGNWCIRSRDATVSGALAPTWIDFAGLGTDAFGVYVTGNYLFFGSDSLRGAAIHSFPDEMMTSCGPVGGAVIHDIRRPSNDVQANALQPAQAHTQNADGETFFVSTDPMFGDHVMLSRLSGNRAGSPTLTSVEISIPPYGAMSNNIDQPQSVADIDGGKSKPSSAVYVDGRVLFSLTTAVAQTPEASGWLTVELDTDTNTRVWDDLYWLGEGRFLTYPALTLEGSTRNGTLAIFGTMTDNETLLTPQTNYASGFVRFYDNRASDNGGISETLVSGTSPYSWFSDDGRNRWGDYSGAAYDWSCGHAWGAMEWANGPMSWKTSIAALDFDGEGGCPQLFVTGPALNQELDSDGVYFITWDAENLPASDEIYVFYQKDGELPVQISDALPVTQRQLSWAIPELPGDDIRVIVGSFDDAASEYSALHYSDPFTIVDADAPQPNPLVWQNPPAATSPSALAMSTVIATDGSGGLVQYLFAFAGNPNGGSGGVTRDWGALPAYQNTGLQPNYEYCYHAISRDQALNQTFYTPIECAYTLAAVPTLGSFTDVSNTSITVQANENGNSSNTEYQFENLTTELASPWLDVPLWEDTGLLPDRSYAYRIRARNADGIETAWATLGAAATTNDDSDGDGVLAADDNCLDIANADQRDTDGDNIGNACDYDLSQDCTVNVVDLGLLRARFFSADPDADFNGDGVVNVIDLGLLRTGFFGQPGPSGRLNLCVVPN
ncbi:MAG: hypothetical protein AB8G17_01375 [Gammaproteobacteria bacterium]